MRINGQYVMPDGHETQPSHFDRPSNLQRFIMGVIVGAVTVAILASGNERSENVRQLSGEKRVRR